MKAAEWLAACALAGLIVAGCDNQQSSTSQAPPPPAQSSQQASGVTDQYGHERPSDAKKVTCPGCKGAKVMKVINHNNQEETCTYCEGQGWVWYVARLYPNCWTPSGKDLNRFNNLNEMPDWNE
jgi:DnaJ-class molecular chaperone